MQGSPASLVLSHPSPGFQDGWSSRPFIPPTPHRRCGKKGTTPSHASPASRFNGKAPLRTRKSVLPHGSLVTLRPVPLLRF